MMIKKAKNKRQSKSDIFERQNINQSLKIKNTKTKQII